MHRVKEKCSLKHLFTCIYQPDNSHKDLSMCGFCSKCWISLHKKANLRQTLPALCKVRMAVRMLVGGGDANTPPATAADNMPAPMYPEDDKKREG